MKLELSKLSPTAIKVIVGIGIVAAAYLFGTCSKPDSGYAQQMEAWKKERTALLLQNSSTIKKVDSLTSENTKLEAAANKKTTEITTLKANVTVLRTKNIALLATADSDKSECNSKCKGYSNAALGFKREADSLQKVVAIQSSRDLDRLVEIANLRVGINIVLDSNAGLVKQLATVPEYKESKFLGLFPKPNRVVSFLVGAALGAAAVGYVATR